MSLCQSLKNRANIEKSRFLDLDLDLDLNFLLDRSRLEGRVLPQTRGPEALL